MEDKWIHCHLERHRKMVKAHKSKKESQKYQWQDRTGHLKQATIWWKAVENKRNNTDRQKHPRILWDHGFIMGSANSLWTHTHTHTLAFSNTTNHIKLVFTPSCTSVTIQKSIWYLGSLDNWDLQGFTLTTGDTSPQRPMENNETPRQT